MTIKAQTLEQIEQVFSQNKKYYRVNEFPFAVSKNGYSSHEGAILRHYLRTHGYVRVRISLVNKEFLAENNIQLKSSNVIIIKVADFVQIKPKTVIEEIVRTTRYLLLKRVSEDRLDDMYNYYWVRVTTDNGYRWIMGYKDSSGSITSSIAGYPTDINANLLEAEYQHIIKNQ